MEKLFFLNDGNFKSISQKGVFGMLLACFIENKEYFLNYLKKELAKDDILTIKDVCELLSISRATVYRKIKSGEITPIPGQGHLRFLKSEISTIKKYRHDR